MDSTAHESATNEFKTRLAEMADPVREFRRHLIMKQEDEEESDNISMSMRMNEIYSNQTSNMRKPSGVNIAHRISDPSKSQFLKPNAEG